MHVLVMKEELYLNEVGLLELGPYSLSGQMKLYFVLLAVIQLEIVLR